VDERIGDAEEDIAHGKHDFKVHAKDNAEDMKQINGHLHRIDLQLTEQTQILKRIERSP
jgi:predicted RNA-binding protein